MELINSTAVPASLLVADSQNNQLRAVLGIAKATFVVSSSGEVSLDGTDPLPIYTEDQPTRFGLLPKDDVPRLDSAFEVMVLGSAVSPSGRPEPVIDVSLQVGEEQRALKVFGDRFWQGEGEQSTTSKPEPFVDMPLDWSQAFGGTAPIEIDDDSFIELAHALNREGKGFDYISQMDDVQQAFVCPAGYPRYATPGPLPNIEDPAALISRPSDVPLAACWAPCPTSSGMVAERMERARRAAGDNAEALAQAEAMTAPFMLHRAHPDWVIVAPEEHATVHLSGMTENGHWAFALPDLRVVLKVSVAGKQKDLELHPNTLILLPGLRKFTLTYRGVQPFRYSPEDERSATLRTESGWVPLRPTHQTRGG